MNIRFGKLKVTTPKVEKIELEKYDFPVLTMYSKPTEPKGKYKFNLNTAALGLVPENMLLVFGYTDENNTLLTNPVIGMFPNMGNKVNAVGNFFSKQDHEDLCTFYRLNGSEEVEFTLIKTAYDVYTVEPLLYNEIEGIVDDMFHVEDTSNAEEPTPMQQQMNDFNNQANEPYI